MCILVTSVLRLRANAIKEEVTSYDKQMSRGDKMDVLTFQRSLAKGLNSVSFDAKSVFQQEDIYLKH